MTDMIICGLTSWENEAIRNHKGECKWCGHYYDKEIDGEFIPCSKDIDLTNGLKSDCKEWSLDMR